MDEAEIAVRADCILSQVPLIDGHNDWPHLIRGLYDNQIENPRFEPSSKLVGHVDISRLALGKSGGVFLSAFMGCPPVENDFSDEAHLELVRDTLQQIDLIYRLVDKYEQLQIVTQATSILPTFEQGKIACLIGVEGLHQIGNSSSVLRMYHRLGVRYLTLTHNHANLYADSSSSTQPVHQGLSQEGLAMIREMNRIGMMIDLSHASDAAARATLEASLAPVAFTHSSAYGLCKHPRNVTDEVLRMLKKNDGVIMVTFVKSFVNDDPAKASVSGVVDHIVYIADRIGYDHIGIGSDFDGTDQAVPEDVAKFPALVAELLRRGIDETDIKKVLGLNIIRVLCKIEEISQEKVKELPVLEDKVKQIWSDDIRKYARSFYPDAV